MRSVELPGIGTKYEIDGLDGKIAIVFLENNNIQVYVLEKSCDKPCVVTLTPKDAVRLGNILTGAIFESKEEFVEVVFSALADLRIGVHTYIVPKSLAGKTIEELDLRRKTGVTIIAISREGKNIVNPSPSTELKEGDVIVVIGEHDQIEKFEKLILGR
ncbi:cation:proton antiporter regulatory subunit [Archaeoglobus sp.]